MAKENANKKKMLKEVVKELHGGASPTEVKEKFKKVLKGTKPEDIAKIEQELVKEGMPREELQRLCDVHLAVFGEQVQDQELHIPAGHPISILIEEHRVMLEKAERLETLVKMLEEACDSVYVGDALTELQTLVKDFQDSEKHYLREENLLFPTMEKHGVTEPPAIMWMEHNRIREIKKKLYDLVEKWNTMPYSDFKTRLSQDAWPLCGVLPDHFFKENNILFPTALQVITEKEWEDIRKEFDEIGYPSFTPSNVLAAFHAAQSTPKAAEPSANSWQFETGSLSKEEAEAILDTLPVDISFIDKDDRVKYFNKAEKRIFVRTKAVIGRSVQLCHPQKSIHIVNKIVEAFTTGEKDKAEFWINMNNRLVHIRYFAVRDKNGKYLGTMEVTQDLTDLKKIEGERRLLDWKE
jgi:PAS domain S-box-containing protein